MDVSPIYRNRRAIKIKGYKKPIRKRRYTFRAFGDSVKSAHIYVDGEGGNDYRRKVKSYFRKNLPKQMMKELSYQDSKKNNLIQLADMVVGAARRVVERDESKYIKIVKKRIVKIRKELE